MKIKFVQNIIDKFRHKVWRLDKFVAKENDIKSNRDFSTLILGSSHIMHYSAAEGELNAAFGSQDLYDSYMLYKQLNHDKLKNVVLSFSVFSPGYCSLKTNGEWKMNIIYKLFFGIDYEYEEVAKSKNLYKEERYMQKAIEKQRKSYVAGKYSEKTSKKQGHHDNEYAQKRAIGHLKNNMRDPDEMRWCYEIIKATKENGQKLIFFIPPAMENYKNNLPSSDILFKKLYDMCSEFDHIKILNYYDNKDFCENDFWDSDHLGVPAWQDSYSKNSMSNQIREVVKNL